MRNKVLLCLSVFASPIAAQELELEPREFSAGDITYSAEVGQLVVPQLHEEPQEGALLLAVCVLRSSAEEPGPPVFYLNGIPSGAIETRDWETWAPYLETADVVLIDQRGCGRSEPRLVWDREPFRAEKLFGSPEGALAHAVETAEAIRAYTDENGVHLKAFNTRESARDIDAVRAALGYDKIRVIGHSGGAHLGLEYVRQYGERVANFVSLGTAGPNDIHSLPSTLDESLRRVSELAAADPRIGAAMPDLFGRIQGLLPKLDESPLELTVEHPETGEEVTLLLGRQGFQFILLLDLGDPADFILFPRVVHEIEQGETQTLTWFARRRYRQMAEWPALLFINRGASGATADRWAKIRSQAKQSPFGMVRCNYSPEIDAAFGIEDLGDGFREPVRSKVSTLFVSGSLDANTPPERAERAQRGFPNSEHLVVENGGHDTILNHPEVHTAIRSFFEGGSVADVHIAMPVPRFAILEGHDDLVLHPALEN